MQPKWLPRRTTKGGGIHGCTVASCVALSCMLFCGVALGLLGAALGLYYSHPTVTPDEWASPRVAESPGFTITDKGGGDYHFELAATVFPNLTNNAKVTVSFEAHKMEYLYVPVAHFVDCLADGKKDCSLPIYSIETVEADYGLSLRYKESKAQNLDIKLSAVVGKNFVDDVQLDCGTTKQLMLILRILDPTTILDFLSKFVADYTYDIAFLMPCPLPPP